MNNFFNGRVFRLIVMGAGIAIALHFDADPHAAEAPSKPKSTAVVPGGTDAGHAP